VLLLDIQDLRKSFALPGGAPQLIIDVTRFRLEAGEELALAGESGSGKSTFLNLIAGILTPDSGRVILAGREMSSLSEPARDRWRAATLGYVFQSFNLLQGYTCLENVLLAMSFGPGADRGRAESLLGRVGLAEHLEHRPRQLSAGQQQRVAVARALANRPKLVLADEPTGNLDRRNAAEVVRLIRETCREAGAALLLVTHDPEVLRRFPRVQTIAEINHAGSPGEALT
jgi:ABC-type lipoprotein export system ATPase subunit